ncbi:MAG: sensor histidine kinase [Minisyncoccota bacterium]
MFSFSKKPKVQELEQQITQEEYKEATEAMYKQNLEIVRLNKVLDQTNHDLKIANDGQENLIHIMNHQIKGYLAKARDIFAELKTEQDYGIPESAKPMISEGFNSLTEGVNFVQQVLRGSSARSGKLEYKMTPTDFRPIAYVATEEMVEQAKTKGLTLNFFSDSDEYKMIGDGIQLREAVKNLVSNSINYTQKGSIEVKMKKGSDKVLLSVEDTGIGISEEDMPKLFQKGGRGKDSLKYNVNSTGYGLAFVKGVVEAHKGRVWVKSEGQGKGSTFYIELPLA